MRCVQVKYTHSARGGRLTIDGHNLFRHYYLGHCSNLTAVYFAAKPDHLPSNVHHLVNKKVYGYK